MTAVELAALTSIRRRAEDEVHSALDFPDHFRRPLLALGGSRRPDAMTAAGLVIPTYPN